MLARSRIHDLPERLFLLVSMAESLPVPVTERVLALRLPFSTGRTHSSFDVLDAAVGMGIGYYGVDGLILIVLVERAAVSIVYAAFAETAFVMHSKCGLLVEVE
jgi:hypothetical protein